MKALILTGTEDTPDVKLDYESGQYVFSGRSLPEDVNSFYEPVLGWLNEFGMNPKSGSFFDFKLEYFNTASSKVLLDILIKLEEIQNDKNCQLTVRWHYQQNDEDMQEAGEEYKELVEVPFEIVSYS